MVKQALAAAALCLALAACGSGKERPPPPSKAAFVSAANKVCAGATTHSARVTGLQALRPPAGAEELYAHWLTAEKDALAAARDVASPPEDAEGDPLVRLAIAEGKATGYAKRLGARACTPSRGGRMPA